ncbi:MAG TPA: type II toxin-antitoxin system HicB family antitoxin [Ktedonobacterales bacterium]
MQCCAAGEDISDQNERIRYSMLIQWSDEDDTYIVTVPELPGYITHGATYDEAVKHGQEAIESRIEANRAWGHPIPAPHTLASI